MALMKLKDYYPDHENLSSDLDDIKGFDVYAQGDDKVGAVDDILVDDTDGRFRYFVVDTGFWVFGKKVLLPVGMANVDEDAKRIYVNSLTREQVENLPNFNDLDKLDFDQEEQVRGVYRPMAATTSVAATPTMGTTDTAYDRTNYSYDRDPSLYSTRDDQRGIKLYEERLIADKRRQKSGEVVIGKHVETETARVSVPVEKERVVVERVAPTESVVGDATGAFADNATVRMEVYEETPDIHKETILREEVRVKKVVDRDTVEANETIRREELDLDTQGRPTINE